MKKSDEEIIAIALKNYAVKICENPDLYSKEEKINLDKALKACKTIGDMDLIWPQWYVMCLQYDCCPEKQMINKTENNFIIGVFYEEIKTKEIYYSYGTLNENNESVILLRNEIKPKIKCKYLKINKEFLDNNFILRKELQDFPNAFDPRLPYIFDLNYDIKCESQLISEILNDNKQLKLFNKLLKKTGLEPLTNKKIKELKIKYEL